MDSSQPEFTLPAKSPFDATVVTLDAGDVLADAILQVASDPLDFPLLKKGRSVAASSRNFDLNGEARIARTKQSSPIIPPA